MIERINVDPIEIIIWDAENYLDTFDFEGMAEAEIKEYTEAMKTAISELRTRALEGDIWVGKNSSFCKDGPQHWKIITYDRDEVNE